MSLDTTTTTTTTTTASLPRIPQTNLDELGQHGWTVVPQFLNEDDWQALAADLKHLHTHQHFEVAKIGQDGLVQDETTPFRDIRHSETCSLITATTTSTTTNAASNDNDEEKKAEASEDEATKDSPSSKLDLPPNDARNRLLETLQQLKVDLQTSDTLLEGPATASLQTPLEPTLHEVLYAYYPPHGYYKRHVDAERGSVSSWRQYSFLLYLNDANWNAAHDGGALRLHRDDGHDTLPVGALPNFVDVAPQGGALVVFRSDLMPHEVLPTQKPRCAVVGWFLSQDTPHGTDAMSKRKTTMSQLDSNVLDALRGLRESIPSLNDKLEPKRAQPDAMSGLLGDDWGIVMPTDDAAPVAATPAGPKPVDDTDPEYWKSVAALDEHGRLVTLGLGGQRLRRLASYEALLSNHLYTSALTTLDLANTDLPLPQLVHVLEQAQMHAPNLTQVYLGGNGLGNRCQDTTTPLTTLAPLLTHLSVLDLRYNDLDEAAAPALHQLIGSESRIEKLYLEGNCLGDKGVQTMVLGDDDSNSRLRELYLGQNDIGPDGAAVLATSLPTLLKQLEKLYLEGNRIGSAGAQAFQDVLLDKNQILRLHKLYVDNNGLNKQQSIALGHAVGSATVVGEGGIFQE